MTGVPTWFIYVNAFLRVALELTALAALAIWGWRTGGIALAVLIPLAAVLAWALFATPRARWYLPLGGRLAVEAVIFGAATVALISLGYPVLAVNLAVLAGANSILVHLNRDDERVRKGLPLPGKRG
jgi:hypothetical protein